MNKYIMNKKKDKLNYKKSFSKQDLLFLKKYPRLYLLCKVNDINYFKANSVFKRIDMLEILNKEEIENAIYMIIVAKENNWTFKQGSRGDYYKRIFDEAGIKF